MPLRASPLLNPAEPGGTCHRVGSGEEASLSRVQSRDGFFVGLSLALKLDKKTGAEHLFRTIKLGKRHLRPAERCSEKPCPDDSGCEPNGACSARS